MTDRRRRQWVPIASTFAFGNTGTKLKVKFGRDGLLVWVCFLAACKKNWIQGQFEYTSEPDGWNRLGLYGYQPDFTLKEFFSYTGQLKKTSRRRRGDLVNVLCSQWEDWNDEIKRDSDADRMRWKRAGNTATPQRLPGDGTATIQPTDSDIEIETPKPPFRKSDKSTPSAVKRLETFIRNGGYELTDHSLREEIAQQGVNGKDETSLLELAHELAERRP